MRLVLPRVSMAPVCARAGPRVGGAAPALQGAGAAERAGGAGAADPVQAVVHQPRPSPARLAPRVADQNEAGAAGAAIWI